MVADDPSSYVVLMEGAGEKAFCAGGDIRGTCMVCVCVCVGVCVCVCVCPYNLPCIYMYACLVHAIVSLWFFVLGH